MIEKTRKSTKTIKESLRLECANDYKYIVILPELKIKY